MAPNPLSEQLIWLSEQLIWEFPTYGYFVSLPTQYYEEDRREIELLINKNLIMLEIHTAKLNWECQRYQLKWPRSTFPSYTIWPCIMFFFTIVSSNII